MSRLSIIGIAIVAVFVLVAIFAPWIATHDVGATNLSVRYLGPSAGHWFGTDSTGRDIFSRVVFGARISLEVGIIVVTVSAFVGTLIGAVAGYYGVMIEEARDLSTLQAAPHALIFPGLAIALTVLAFNFVGDGLREYLDPRQRRR